jgi:hypothetical protein
MGSNVIESGGYKQISASANISTIPTNIVGIFVSNAASTPTLTIYDDAGTGTSTPICTVFTPVSATFYSIPVATSKGLYVVIGGTVSCTVIFC